MNTTTTTTRTRQLTAALLLACCTLLAADKKISELTARTSLLGTDIIEVAVPTVGNYKMTGTNLAGSIGTLLNLSGNYQAKDATLTALAGLSTGSGKMFYSTGTDTFSQFDTTSYGRGLLSRTDAGSLFGTGDTITPGRVDMSQEGFGLGVGAWMSLSYHDTSVGTDGETNYITLRNNGKIDWASTNEDTGFQRVLTFDPDLPDASAAWTGTIKPPVMTDGATARLCAIEDMNLHGGKMVKINAGGNGCEPITAGDLLTLMGAQSTSGTLALNGFGAVTGSLALARIAQGGATSGQVLAWNGSAWAATTANSLPTQTGNNGKFLTTDGSAASWAAVSLTAGVTGTLPVANGGTGITSLGSGVATFLGTPSSANLAGAITDETGSGAAVFGTSPTITTPAISGASTLTNSATGSTATPGFTLTNATAASVGAQQYSPFIVFSGNGWKTTATAASQQVEFRTGLVPVQGTTAPTASLQWDKRINGGSGSWTTLMQLYEDSTANPVRLSLGGVLGANGTGVLTAGNGGVTFGRGDTAYNQVFIGYGTTYNVVCSADTLLGWSGSNASNAGDIRFAETFFSREGSYIIQFGADSASPINYSLKGADATGTNGAGGDVTFAGGRNTGSASGGHVYLKTSPAGSSGTTPGTLRTVIDARPDGHVDMPAATVEAAASAASTHKITIYINGTRYKVLAIQE